MNVLFIVGPHAVGKTYYMDKILKEYEAFKFDTGPHMRQIEQSDFERYIAAENEGGLGNLKKYVLENQGECQYFFKSSNDDFAEIELFGKKKFHLQSPNLEID